MKNICIFANPNRDYYFPHRELNTTEIVKNSIDINARMLFLNIKKRDVYCLL